MKHQSVSDAALTRIQLKRGDTFVLAGEYSKSIYAIRSGYIQTQYFAPDGPEQGMEFQYAGEVIGLDGNACGHYSCDALALEDSEVLRIVLS